MFAGHSMLFPYDGKESPRRDYMSQEKLRTLRQHSGQGGKRCARIRSGSFG
jgi:hypothetical protein